MQYVYRSYDQDTLDRECNPSLVIPDADGYLETYAIRSKQARERLDPAQTVAFGGDPMQTMDIFRSRREEPQPIHVFLHGGGWRMLSRTESSFVAEGLGSEGAVVVVPSYRLIPSVELDDVIEDAYAALRWVHEHAEEIGGDRNRIYLSGHSAGAHLCGMVVQEQGRSLPSNLIKGAILASGNYELEPIRLSARNKLLRFDDACVARNSPTRLRPQMDGEVLVVWGEHESNQYKDQGRELAAAWRAGGVGCREWEIPKLNHLDVPLEFADAGSALTAAALTQMSRA